MISRLRSLVFAVSVVALVSVVLEGSTTSGPLDAGTLPARVAPPAPVDRSHPLRWLDDGRVIEAALAPRSGSGIVLSARTRSALLDRVVPKRQLRPVAVRIDALSVSALVAPVGLRPGGELDVPPGASGVSWYRDGVSPGAAGSAVLAGHVDWDGERGAFFSLSHLDPGAIVTVGYDDGSTRRFSVVARRQYAKAALPTAELFSTSGPAQLVLVTCGGSFDRAARHYRDNVVVVAVPVA